MKLDTLIRKAQRYAIKKHYRWEDDSYNSLLGHLLLSIIIGSVLGTITLFVHLLVGGVTSSVVFGVSLYLWAEFTANPVWKYWKARRGWIKKQEATWVKIEKGEVKTTKRFSLQPKDVVIEYLTDKLTQEEERRYGENSDLLKKIDALQSLRKRAESTLCYFEKRNSKTKNPTFEETIERLKKVKEKLINAMERFTKHRDATKAFFDQQRVRVDELRDHLTDYQQMREAEKIIGETEHGCHDIGQSITANVEAVLCATRRQRKIFSTSTNELPDVDRLNAELADMERLTTSSI